MSTNLMLLILAGGAALLTSCIPAPSTTPVFPRIDGKIVEAKTCKPIPAAKVVATRAGYTRQATTSASGQFTLPSASQWHYLIYIGSPGVAPVPWHLRNVPDTLTVTASAPGYKASSITFSGRKENRLFLKMPDTLQIPLQR